MTNPLKKYGLFGWNYCYLLMHPWKIAEEAYYHIKWFIQRGYRGYADCDVWSLDSYLAGWMPAALLKLQMNKLGHPCGMTRRGWDTRLQIMREGFMAVTAIGDIPQAKEYRRLERVMNKGLKVFQKHYLSLWD
jgi:hypothetical protein